MRVTRARPFAPFTARALPIIRSIPRGKVASYGQLAAMAGSPGAARQIVRILHSLSRRERLPWQRVIRSDGTVALRPGNGFEMQCAALKKEGVRVSPDGHVDMKRYGWTASGTWAADRQRADRRSLTRRKPRRILSGLGDRCQ